MRVLLLVLADDWAERALDILNGRLRVGGIALLARAELVKRDVKQPGNVLDAGSLALDKLRVTVCCGQRCVLEAVIQHRNAVSVVRSGVDAFPLGTDFALDVHFLAADGGRPWREVGVGGQNAAHLTAVAVVVALIPLRLQSRLNGLGTAAQIADALEAVRGKCFVMQHIGRPELAELVRLGIDADIPQLCVGVEDWQHVAWRDRQQLHRLSPLVAQDERVSVAVRNTPRLHQLVIVKGGQGLGRSAGQQPHRRMVGHPLAGLAVHQVDRHFRHTVRDDLDAGIDGRQLHSLHFLSAEQGAAARAPSGRVVQRQRGLTTDAV